MLRSGFVFYLEGGPQKILVDTGVGSEGVIRALAGIGLKPEDIDIVILTHLHFDHADNVAYFIARFILQRKNGSMLNHSADSASFI